MARKAERSWQTVAEYLDDLAQALASPFVLNHTIESSRTGADTMSTAGEVFCRSDVVIDVELAGEYQRLGQPPLWNVRLVAFRYNAYIRDVDDSAFLRYDQWLNSPAPPFYHVHRWNPRTRQLLDDHKLVEYVEMPDLGAVIAEVAAMISSS